MDSVFRYLYYNQDDDSTNLQLAAELGKTLLERNQELEETGEGGETAGDLAADSAASLSDDLWTVTTGVPTRDLCDLGDFLSPTSSSLVYLGVARGAGPLKGLSRNGSVL
ncbi:hypothetical protein MTO96_013352 [Rhipicephalus appendiculatus]